MPRSKLEIVSSERSISPASASWLSPRSRRKARIRSPIRCRLFTARIIVPDVQIDHRTISGVDLYLHPDFSGYTRLPLRHMPHIKANGIGGKHAPFRGERDR